METCDSELSQLTKSLIKKLSLEIKLNNSRINSHNYVCSIVDIMLSSDINEVITAVLNSFFFYEKILHVPKAPKAPKVPKGIKTPRQKHNTKISKQVSIFPLDVF